MGTRLRSESDQAQQPRALIRPHAPDVKRVDVPSNEKVSDRSQPVRAGHHAIVRALACKWLRILWRCWQTRQEYNQEKYLQQLEKRRSPIAARARQLALEIAA